MKVVYTREEAFSVALNITTVFDVEAIVANFLGSVNLLRVFEGNSSSVQIFFQIGEIMIIQALPKHLVDLAVDHRFNLLVGI